MALAGQPKAALLPAAGVGVRHKMRSALFIFLILMSLEALSFSCSYKLLPLIGGETADQIISKKYAEADYVFTAQVIHQEITSASTVGFLQKATLSVVKSYKGNFSGEFSLQEQCVPLHENETRLYYMKKGATAGALEPIRIVTETALNLDIDIFSHGAQ